MKILVPGMVSIAKLNEVGQCRRRAPGQLRRPSTGACSRPKDALMRHSPATCTFARGVSRHDEYAAFPGSRTVGL
jgi:hypothetical protein